MKKLVFISGTMGVGKSTVSGLLLGRLQNAVFLDGDWCWKIHPFIASAENKRMVLNNIGCLLRGFLDNSSFETVIFCWVMHEERIAREVLRRLGGRCFELHRFKLVCGADVLRARLQKDVDKGIREAEVIERSVARLPLYETVEGTPLDVGRMTAEQAADEIARIIAPLSR